MTTTHHGDNVHIGNKAPSRIFGVVNLIFRNGHKGRRADLLGRQKVDRNLLDATSSLAELKSPSKSLSVSLIGDQSHGKSTILGLAYKTAVEMMLEADNGIVAAVDPYTAAAAYAEALDQQHFPVGHLAGDITKTVLGVEYKHTRILGSALVNWDTIDLNGTEIRVVMERMKSAITPDQVLEAIEQSPRFSTVCSSPVFCLLIDSAKAARVDGSYNTEYDRERATYVSGIKLFAQKHSIQLRGIMVLWTKFDFFAHAFFGLQQPSDVQYAGDWNGYLAKLTRDKLPQLFSQLSLRPTHTQVNFLPVWVLCEHPDGQFVTEPNVVEGYPKPIKPLNFSRREMRSLLDIVGAWQ